MNASYKALKFNMERHFWNIPVTLLMDSITGIRGTEIDILKAWEHYYTDLKIPFCTVESK